MDWNPPGSFVHGILQQEYWSVLSFPSPDFSHPGYQIHGSCGSCTGRHFLHPWASWKALKIMLLFKCVFVFFKLISEVEHFSSFFALFKLTNPTQPSSAFFVCVVALCLLTIFKQLWHTWLETKALKKSLILRACWDFSGGSVVKNLPANEGDTSLIPDPGRSHMLQSN